MQYALLGSTGAIYKVGAALAEEGRVYPTWFIERLGDEALQKALA
jgi:hypothetical protein